MKETLAKSKEKVKEWQEEVHTVGLVYASCMVLVMCAFVLSIAGCIESTKAI